MAQRDQPAFRPADISNDVDVFDLLEILWKDKGLIAVFVGCAALASLMFALSLPNLYTASVLLKPQSADGGIASLARQYGGLASLAGISLPSGGGETKVALAVEVLKSKNFAYDFVTRHQLLPALFAAKAWDWETKQLSLDEKIYDPSAGGWVRETVPPRAARPGPEEVHERWGQILSVDEDQKTSFITLSIEHQSPVFAKVVLELLVDDINEALRAKDLQESERFVAYLEGQLKETNVAEIRELLAGLLRSHLESRMMAIVEPSYAFSVIDPPTVPELKSGPMRALICIVGTILGGMAGVLAALARQAYQRRASTAAS